MVKLCVTPHVRLDDKQQASGGLKCSMDHGGFPRPLDTAVALALARSCPVQRLPGRRRPSETAWPVLRRGSVTPSDSRSSLARLPACDTPTFAIPCAGNATYSVSMTDAVARGGDVMDGLRLGMRLQNGSLEAIYEPGNGHHVLRMQNTLFPRDPGSDTSAAASISFCMHQ